MTNNDQEKANVLNSFFSSVFVKENDEPIPDLEVNIEKELNDIKITENDMLNILKNLNPSKSPGPDKIHPRLIKELSTELADPLHLLFGKTITDGGIPKSWKEFGEKNERVSNLTNFKMIKHPFNNSLVPL